VPNLYSRFEGAKRREFTKKEISMRPKIRIGAALAAGLGMLSTVAFAAPARAQGGIQVGTITCNVAGGWGFIFGSSRDLACTFSGPRRVEYYRGTISKFGVDIGYTRGGVLIWTVFSPTAILRPGDLAGTYGGGTASATIGLGIGANGLIGGNNNHIVLQPLSIETNRGLNVAAGIAAMTLYPAR
jgi:hypothetical protein